MRSDKRLVLEPPGGLAGVKAEVRRFGTREIIYSQGEPGKTVLYIQKGAVRLSARTQAGQEAVVGILGPGDFIGEKCLIGWLLRGTAATATAPSTLLIIEKDEMQRVLRTKHPLSDVFMSFLLARNARIDEDLVDNLYHSAEERLARILLRLAGQRDQNKADSFAEITQETLARMIGTTRSRVNVFLKRFRDRGLITYTDKDDGHLKLSNRLRVNTTRLATVLDK